MTRVEQNSAPLLRYVFDSEATNVTIQVLASDGTELVATTSLVNQVSPTEYTYQLAPDATDVLDDLTVIWTATVDEVAQTYTDKAEVVGALLFTVAQAREALGDPAYSRAKIEEARTYAEMELDKSLGFALVPRYARETVQVARYESLRLRPFVRSIRSVTTNVGGTMTFLTPTQLGLLSINQTGFVSGYYWPNGFATVEYEHGLDVNNDLFPGAKRHALAMAVEYLGGGTGTVDPRAERVITDDGTIVYGTSGGGQFQAKGVNGWVSANKLIVGA